MKANRVYDDNELDYAKRALKSGTMAIGEIRIVIMFHRILKRLDPKHNDIMKVQSAWKDIEVGMGQTIVELQNEMKSNLVVPSRKIITPEEN